MHAALIALWPQNGRCDSAHLLNSPDPPLTLPGATVFAALGWLAEGFDSPLCGWKLIKIAHPHSRHYPSDTDGCERQSPRVDPHYDEARYPLDAAPFGEVPQSLLACREASGNRCRRGAFDEIKLISAVRDYNRASARYV